MNLEELKPIIKHKATQSVRHAPDNPDKEDTVYKTDAVITRHAPDTADTVNTDKTVITSYAIDVYNAILQQEAEAAQAALDDAEDPACAVADRKGSTSHECKCQRKVEYDTVNHPSHYCQGGIECIDAIQAAVTGLTGMEAVCTGQIIKYVWRWKHKNGTEDLQKARFYLNKLILLADRRTDNGKQD